MHDLGLMEREIYEPFRLFGLTTPASDTSTVEGRLKRKPIIREYIRAFVPGHENMQKVIVTGTAGKGSTATYIGRLLEESGRTGVLMSPHVYRFNERITLNGRPVGDNELIETWQELKEVMASLYHERGDAYILSFQEAILLTALRIFKDNNMDFVILEAGRGGGSDPVSVVGAKVGVITSIGLDHTHLFGHTREDICREKAGIISKDMDFFTAVKEPSLLGIMRDRCRQTGAVFHAVDVNGDDVLMNNAVLAISVASIFNSVTLEPADLVNEVVIPGRRQIVGNTVLDIAHNPMSLEALVKWVDARFGQNTVYVFGAAEEKDIVPMLKQMINQKVVLTSAPYRGANVEILSAAAESLGADFPVFKDTDTAYKKAKEMCKDDGIIVVTGSTYLVSRIGHTLGL